MEGTQIHCEGNCVPYCAELGQQEDAEESAWGERETLVGVDVLNNNALIWEARGNGDSS
jgi:hypothetical protein